MKVSTHISIRTRIYWSFFLLVSLFVINGVITIVTLVSNQKLSDHIYNVTDPSLRAMDDLNMMLIESKMYCTNWVFLRSSQSDKDALLKLHNTDYYKLQSELNAFAAKWRNKKSADSLHKVLSGFEALQSEEKKIMGLLKKFEDYNDPLIKLEAERIIEDEVLPRTMSLIMSLNYIINDKQKIRSNEEANLRYSSGELRILIIAMAVLTACLGLFLSIYMGGNLKKKEDELLNTTANLVQRNKELEQFAYMVSHNLRAPVANILGFSYVLNTVAKNATTEQQHILEALSISAKKLDDIVIDLNHILQARRESALTQG